MGFGKGHPPPPPTEMQIVGGGPVPPQALYVRQETRYRGEGNRSVRRLFCRLCGSNHHVTDQCPRFKVDRNGHFILPNTPQTRWTGTGGLDPAGPPRVPGIHAASGSTLQQNQQAGRGATSTAPPAQGKMRISAIQADSGGEEELSPSPAPIRERPQHKGETENDPPPKAGKTAGQESGPRPISWKTPVSSTIAAAGVQDKRPGKRNKRQNSGKKGRGRKGRRLLTETLARLLGGSSSDSDPPPELVGSSSDSDSDVEEEKYPTPAPTAPWTGGSYTTPHTSPPADPQPDETVQISLCASKGDKAHGFYCPLISPNRATFTAFCDLSGADRCCISQTGLQRAEKNGAYSLSRPVNISAKGIGQGPGTSTKVDTEVELKFQLEGDSTGHWFKQAFLLLPDGTLPADYLFGRDICVQYGAALRSAHRQIVWELHPSRKVITTDLEVHHPPGKEDVENGLRTQGSTTIPAGKGTTVEVAVDMLRELTMLESQKQIEERIAQLRAMQPATCSAGAEVGPAPRMRQLNE